MKMKERTEGAEIAIGIGVGAGGSVLLTLVLTALAANLVSREMLQGSSVDALVVGILVLASGAGSAVAGALTGHHRLPVCMLTGILYFAILIGCNAMLFDGVYRAMGVTALAILGGSGAAVLLGLKEGKKGSKIRRPKIKNWKVVQN